MATWATKRKFMYGGLVILGLVLLIGLPTFYFLYHAPTCSDRVLNGDEQGVDCGGSCSRLCQSAFLPATVLWTRFEPLVPGQYNVAAYIVNPNISGAAINAPYKFSLFDSEGTLITEANGLMTIPPHRNALAFINSVQTGKRIVTRAVFEFTSPPLWQKSHDTLGGISIKNKKYAENEGGSSLTVTLQNNSLLPYTDIIVAAVLSDIDGNVVGFSRTHIDEIAPGSSAVAPFTWPASHNGKVITIEVLPVIRPVLDR